MPSSGHRPRCPDCAQHENLRQIDGGCSQEGPGPDSDSRLFGWLRLAGMRNSKGPNRLNMFYKIETRTNTHTYINILLLLIIINYYLTEGTQSPHISYQLFNLLIPPAKSSHLAMENHPFTVGCLQTLISFRIPVVFKFWHFFWISNSPPKKIHPNKEVLDARNGCCSCGHHGLQSAHHCSGQCTWPAGGRGSVQGAAQGHENSVFEKDELLFEINWYQLILL